MLTVAGIPAHPLVVHAVVVLLPLAAVGTLAVAARPVWRRQIGVWLLLLAFVGVAAVPVATQTGEQLEHAIGGDDPLIAIHASRGETLLVPALIFLVLLAVTVVVGRRSDAAEGTGPGAAHALATDTTVLRRITTVAGVLAALAGLVVIGLVVWIGHAGSTAAWSGIGG